MRRRAQRGRGCRWRCAHRAGDLRDLASAARRRRCTSGIPPSPLVARPVWTCLRSPAVLGTAVARGRVVLFDLGIGAMQRDRVRSARGAVPAFRPARFCEPPPESGRPPARCPGWVLFRRPPPNPPGGVNRNGLSSGYAVGCLEGRPAWMASWHGRQVTSVLRRRMAMSRTQAGFSRRAAPFGSR